MIPILGDTWWHKPHCDLEWCLARVTIPCSYLWLVKNDLFLVWSFGDRPELRAQRYHRFSQPIFAPHPRGLKHTITCVPVSWEAFFAIKQQQQPFHNSHSYTIWYSNAVKFSPAGDVDNTYDHLSHQTQGCVGSRQGHGGGELKLTMT
jgi:hypothetical protein